MRPGAVVTRVAFFSEDLHPGSIRTLYVSEATGTGLSPRAVRAALHRKIPLRRYVVSALSARPCVRCVPMPCLHPTRALKKFSSDFPGGPCLAAFYGKPGRIGRIARIGLGCNDVVHGCVAHIAPLRIVERNVLRVAVGIAYDVVGQDVPSELLELCAYDPGRYVCARRAPITCAITRRLT